MRGDTQAIGEGGQAGADQKGGGKKRHHAAIFRAVQGRVTC
jgi:hypothetical protein